VLLSTAKGKHIGNPPRPVVIPLPGGHTGGKSCSDGAFAQKLPG